jgi:type I restriction enzyme S subunit
LIKENSSIKELPVKTLSGYYLLKKGDFAYNKSYSNDYPWGAVKRLEKYDSGVVSTLYIVFSPAKIDLLIIFRHITKLHYGTKKSK